MNEATSMRFSMNEATTMWKAWGNRTAWEQGTSLYSDYHCSLTCLVHILWRMIQLNLLLDMRKSEEHKCGKARGCNTSIWYGGDTQGTWYSSVNMQGSTIKAKYNRSGNKSCWQTHAQGMAQLGTGALSIHLQSQDLSIKQGCPSHLSLQPEQVQHGKI